MLLTNGDKCHECVRYRSNLRHRKQNSVEVSPSIHASTSSHTNIRHLSTPQKSKRYKNLKARCDAAERKVKCLTEQLS